MGSDYNNTDHAAEVRSVLTNILKHKGLSDLVEIMDDLERLLEYKAFVESGQELEPEDRGGTREYIEIKGQLFFTQGIFRLRRRYVSGAHGRFTYGITINEGMLPANAHWYIDTAIAFDTESERDEEWRLILTKMRKQNCTFL